MKIKIKVEITEEEKEILSKASKIISDIAYQMDDCNISCLGGYDFRELTKTSEVVKDILTGINNYKEG